jgi:hypothetical protein
MIDNYGTPIVELDDSDHGNNYVTQLRVMDNMAPDLDSVMLIIEDPEDVTAMLLSRDRATKLIEALAVHFGIITARPVIDDQLAEDLAAKTDAHLGHS